MADYEPVNSHDYQRTKLRDEYSLATLDKDWHGVFLPHLHGVTQTDRGKSFLKEGKVESFDEIDARGTFQKAEVRKELKKMSRLELEGKLGVTSNKLDELLDRAERKTQHRQKGEIKYKAFMEVVREYRLNTEQESTLEHAVRVFAFVEEFSCKPPTFVMVIITILELAAFINTSYYLYTTFEKPLTWTGPVPYCSLLIYNPSRRWEVWRFASYMLVHIGIGHFVFNMIMQILVGVFLEMEQCGVLGSFKVLIVYMSGVLAGSLGTSLSDPATYLAGASGGVYALIAAHLATMALNWQEDNQIRIKKVVKKPITKIIRLSFIIILTLHDVGYAIYVRFYDPENRTGFMGHLCGALAGLTVGIFILDNRRVRSWEPLVQWSSLTIFILFMVTCLVWNMWGEQWSPGFFPPKDESLYEVGNCRDFEFM